METLTDTQKRIASLLIDWVLSHKTDNVYDMLIEEPVVAKQLDESSWKRSHIDDLNILCAYCSRLQFPLVSLLVVIPGLRKPEKTVFTHAFKATLSTAENNKRWAEALNEIAQTPQAVWDDFKSRVEVTETSAPKRTSRTKGESRAKKAPEKKGTPLPKNPLNSSRA